MREISQSGGRGTEFTKYKMRKVTFSIDSFFFFYCFQLVSVLCGILGDFLRGMSRYVSTPCVHVLLGEKKGGEVGV